MNSRTQFIHSALLEVGSDFGAAVLKAGTFQAGIPPPRLSPQSPSCGVLSLPRRGLQVFSYMCVISHLC